MATIDREKSSRENPHNTVHWTSLGAYLNKNLFDCYLPLCTQWPVDFNSRLTILSKLAKHPVVVLDIRAIAQYECLSLMGN